MPPIFIKKNRSVSSGFCLSKSTNIYIGKISKIGTVYLVGAGPGDPGLLTCRGAELIASADVIVSDALVNSSLLSMAPADAEIIFAGKRSKYHTIPQNELNQLLVDRAVSGKKVIRLKGGDPFIFGRGGEEIETLADEKIAFQVVPGITSASGCSTYSGIPLTHRDFAQSCIFVTGHLKEGKLELDWEKLIQPNQTKSKTKGGIIMSDMTIEKSDPTIVFCSV